VGSERTLEQGPAAVLVEHGAALLDDLQAGHDPVLRWYRATDTALVLGRGQRRELLGPTDLPVVGRFSGGGAVLMDPGLLCLDVLIPTGHPWLDGDLGRPFDVVGRAWANALTTFGVTEIAVYTGAAQRRVRGTPREQLLAAICYATLGRGEVTAGGRKLVGLAQRRRRPGALIQCGLLRTWDPRPLLRALRAADDDPQILEAATGLDDLLSPPPSDIEVVNAVAEALRRGTATP
jgi:lipoate-protein ligase A